MRRFLFVILGATVILAVAGGVVGIAEGAAKWGNIAGTDHDVGSAGSPTCFVCHTPHNATSDSLWAKDISAGQAAGYETVKSMCYSCHDGTAVAKGIYIFTGSLNQHPFPATAGSEATADVTDCDSCHDPHGVAPGVAGQFLVSDQTYKGANMCKNCHPESVIGNRSHPINVDGSGDPPAVVYSITDPSSSTTDFTEGTRLFAGATEDASMASGDYVKCLSCHAAHGSVTGTELNSIATSQMGGKMSPLCSNCHG